MQRYIELRNDIPIPPTPGGQALVMVDPEGRADPDDPKKPLLVPLVVSNLTWLEARLEHPYWGKGGAKKLLQAARIYKAFEKAKANGANGSVVRHGYVALEEEDWKAFCEVLEETDFNSWVGLHTAPFIAGVYEAKVEEPVKREVEEVAAAPKG